MKKFSTARRRTLKILAAGGSLVLAPGSLAHTVPRQAFTWRGTALGAKASLTLYHVSDAEGRRLVKRIGEELRRLEQLFSLYRGDSAVSMLNADGYVDDPPIDLVRLLSEARAISDVTEGAFDVTVQPLWKAYAASATRGPDTIDAALELVGYRDVDISSRAIRMHKPGMSVTFNGIAQGYITDRIAELLHAEGLRYVLIDLGEIRALDTHPSGRPWIVGLQDPATPGGVAEVINVVNQAVATSAGSGTLFDGNAAHHHIFDPRSGRASSIYGSISVVGKRATVADALSTGLYNMESERARAALSRFPGYAAHVVFANGRRQTWTG